MDQAEAKWEQDSVTLREDTKTGGIELLVRYPAGHFFKPHWHESNERIVMLGGKLALGGAAVVEAGGYAFLPVRELQTMSCVSNEA